MNVESSDDNLRAVRVEGRGGTATWMEAFDEQCTGALLQSLRRYVVLLARLPGGEHLGDHTSYAEEQVQTAVADLIGRVLRWDPSARSLEEYLTDVIRVRVIRDRTRAARHPHVSIDATHPRDTVSLMREVEEQLAANASMHDPRSTGIAGGTTAMQRLRELVPADPLALRFLEAIEQGAVDRIAIMNRTGFSRAEYHNTRRRLARLLSRLNLGRGIPVKDN